MDINGTEALYKINKEDKRMFIAELIKAFISKEEKKEIPVTVHEVDINNLPKESQEWIRRCYNKKNGIEDSAVWKTQHLLFCPRVINMDIYGTSKWILKGEIKMIINQIIKGIIDVGMYAVLAVSITIIAAWIIGLIRRKFFMKNEQ